MKRALQITWLAGLALFVGLCILWMSSRSSVTSQEQLDIAPFIEQLSGEADLIHKEIAPVSFENISQQKAKQLKKKRWYIIRLQDNKAVYWNSNKLALDSAARTQKQYPTLYAYGDDLYALFKKESDTYFAFRIANDKKLHPQLAQYSDDFKNKQLALRVVHEDSSTVLTFNEENNNDQSFFLLTLILAILFVFLLIKNTLSGSVWMFAAATGIILTNLVGFMYTKLPTIDYFFTSADSFSIMEVSQRNVVLFLHLFSILAVVLVCIRILSKAPQVLHVFLISTGILFLADFFWDLSSRLVLSTQIPFDFEKLFDLNSNSFVALLFISLSFASLWIFIYTSQLSKHLRGKLWLVFVGAILTFAAFQYWDASRTISSLALPGLVAIVGVWIASKIKQPRWAIYAYFVLTALLTATIVAQNHEYRNEELAKEYAIKLVQNKDARAESILQTFENQLAHEFLVPADYDNFISRKELTESRLKHLYFSNYLEKYELKLLSFGPDGSNINATNLYTFPYLDSIFNHHSFRTTSAYFYRLNNASGLNGYIAKYENCDIDGHYGSTFILLQPRVVQSNFLYPEVFKNQENNTLGSIEDYSFGLYFGNQLLSQRGSFPYTLTQPPPPSSSRFSFSDTRHYHYTLDQYKVVLTKQENIGRAWLSTLTFTIVLLLLIGVLCSALSYVFMGKEHPLTRAFLPFFNKFLSSRIQTSLTIILLAGLLLSVYIIINFIQANYNSNLEDQLLSKVKSISATLQNKVDLASKLNNEEQRTLILNEESSTYNVDINLYSPQGTLLSSTKPYLVDQQILGDQMNPEAYTQLTLKKYSQLLIQEELEGSDYLSAYVPLFDGKNTILGYVNTPFFAKNEELNKQISNLVVNILNIYFLLLLGGVILAYVISRQISKPLLLIREKIAKTELRGQNELITYTRQDEVGLLVKQYNKMVMELEESANQMAETEREGAWREMAKQVAHEIKNPLTPMKLSVQHLQRAYDSGPSEKLDKLFAKTSKLIIEQIDSLSNMASEFSNFAKMPEDKFEVFDLAEILESTTDLFKRSENAQIQANINKPAQVFADPEQIRRIFNNLIKNAIQAIPEEREGKIEVNLTNKDSQFVVTVKDNGKGIPKANYNKVFVPNFSTKNSGMGLGLAICRKIVESAKGTVSFTSEVNKGTTFTVILPVHEEA